MEESDSFVAVNASDLDSGNSSDRDTGTTYKEAHLKSSNRRNSIRVGSVSDDGDGEIESPMPIPPSPHPRLMSMSTMFASPSSNRMHSSSSLSSRTNTGSGADLHSSSRASTTSSLLLPSSSEPSSESDLGGIENMNFKFSESSSQPLLSFEMDSEKKHDQEAIETQTQKSISNSELVSEIATNLPRPLAGEFASSLHLSSVFEYAKFMNLSDPKPLPGSETPVTISNRIASGIEDTKIQRDDSPASIPMQSKTEEDAKGLFGKHAAAKKTPNLEFRGCARYLVVGDSGLGRTSCMQRLFEFEYFWILSHDVKGKDNLNLDGWIEHRLRDRAHPTGREICVLDTPGFDLESDHKARQTFSDIYQYLVHQYQETDKIFSTNAPSEIMEEIIANNNGVHSHTLACLYFIGPTGLKQRDLDFMERLGSLVNVVPIVSKADSLETEELFELCEQIRQQIKKSKVDTIQEMWSMCPSFECDAIPSATDSRCASSPSSSPSSASPSTKFSSSASSSSRKPDVANHSEIDSFGGEILDSACGNLKATTMGSNSMKDPLLIPVPLIGARHRHHGGHFGRNYPWGFCDVEQCAHSEIRQLRVQLLEEPWRSYLYTSTAQKYIGWRQQSKSNLFRMLSFSGIVPLWNSLCPSPLNLSKIFLKRPFPSSNSQLSLWWHRCKFLFISITNYLVFKIKHGFDVASESLQNQHVITWLASCAILLAVFTAISLLGLFTLQFMGVDMIRMLNNMSNESHYFSFYGDHNQAEFSVARMDTSAVYLVVPPQASKTKVPSTSYEWEYEQKDSHHPHVYLHPHPHPHPYPSASYAKNDDLPIISDTDIRNDGSDDLKENPGSMQNIMTNENERIQDKTQTSRAHSQIRVSLFVPTMIKSHATWMPSGDFKEEEVSRRMMLMEEKLVWADPSSYCQEPLSSSPSKKHNSESCTKNEFDSDLPLASPSLYENNGNENDFWYLRRFVNRHQKYYEEMSRRFGLDTEIQHDHTSCENGNHEGEGILSQTSSKYRWHSITNVTLVHNVKMIQMDSDHLLANQSSPQEADQYVRTAPSGSVISSKFRYDFLTSYSTPHEIGANEVLILRAFFDETDGYRGKHRWMEVPNSPWLIKCGTEACNILRIVAPYSKAGQPMRSLDNHDEGVKTGYFIGNTGIGKAVQQALEVARRIFHRISEKSVTAIHRLRERILWSF